MYKLLLLFPFTVPRKKHFAKPEDLKIWPNNLRFFDQGQDFVIFSYGCFDRSATILIDDIVIDMFGSISSQRPASFFSSSAVKVQDSKTDRNMDMPWERINFTFDPRDMLLSLHIDFRFVTAAVGCAVFEKPPVLRLHLMHHLLGI